MHFRALATLPLRRSRAFLLLLPYLIWLRGLGSQPFEPVWHAASDLLRGPSVRQVSETTRVIEGSSRCCGHSCFEHIVEQTQHRGPHSRRPAWRRLFRPTDEALLQD